MDNVLIQTADYLWSQSIQIGVLVIVVALIGHVLSRQSAHLRYLLWLIVVAKCLVPPFLHVTVPILPQDKPGSPQGQLEQYDRGTGGITVPETPAAAGGDPAGPPQEVKLAHGSVSGLSWRGAITIAWLAGVAFFLATVSIKAGRMARRLVKERTAVSAQMFLQQLGSPGIAWTPGIWLIDSADQPFVWGLWRGDIYLPAAFMQLSREHQRDILAHELSHVLRFDAAVNLLQVVAQAIFWFHPLVWWTNSRIRQEREKCCDEMVIARLGAQPRSYSRAIIATLLTEHQSNTGVPSLAIAGPAKNIEERIKTMLRPGKRFHQRPSLPATACALALALLSVPTSLALTARPAEAAASPVSTESLELQQRTLSAQKLKQVAISLTLYAAEHEKKYPNAIGEITPYYSQERADELLTFATTEVEYLGAGKTSPDTNAFSMPLAFDAVLLRVADGTNVAFADSHVDFVRKDGLAAYGITIPENHLENEQWKIDWIAGYVPAIIRMQEEEQRAPATGSSRATIRHNPPVHLDGAASPMRRSS